MRYKLVILPYLLLVCLLANTHSSRAMQTETTRLSLLTYSPGDRLYSLFGHSAIRIRNTEQNIDEVYNYGTFDFNQPNFYLSFIRGKLNYSLSVTRFEFVKQSVILENRSLIESPLNLDPNEKARIISFLQKNARPENKYYLYDFQYDNCSNRVLNVIDAQIQDSLHLNPEVLPVGTFRRLLSPYLKERPWVHAGIDLLLGLRADRMAQLTEPAFLPDYLHLFIKNYKLERPGGLQNLSDPDRILVSNYPSVKKKIVTPGLFGWALVILLSLSVFIDSHFRKPLLALGNLFLFIAGLLSLFLIFLWVFPDHRIFANNTDILWANPFLLLLFFLRGKTGNRWVRFLIILSLILAILGVLSTMLVEHNTDLTSLACLISIQLITLLRRKTHTMS